MFSIMYIILLVVYVVSVWGCLTLSPCSTQSRHECPPHCHCHFAAAPAPPTGVSVEDGAECYTSEVSWAAPQDRCGVLIRNYSVRYQLRNSGGNYTTVYTNGTTVTLEGILANEQYNVSVASINSQMGKFTDTIQFELQGELYTLKCCVSL